MLIELIGTFANLIFAEFGKKAHADRKRIKKNVMNSGQKLFTTAAQKSD